MKLDRIVIKNYKSIGEEHNELILNNNINIIIGKNESGKSNIIDSLSKMNITQILDQNFSKYKNKINKKEPVFILKLKPYTSEQEYLGESEEVEITINSDSDISFTNKEYIPPYMKDKDFTDAKEIMNNIINTSNNYYFYNIPKLELLINDINKAGEKLFVRKSEDVMRGIEDFKKKYPDNTHKEELEKLEDSIKKCRNCLTEFHNYFPTFFYVDNKVLKGKYTKKEIENDEMFNTLLEAAGIKKEDVLNYLNTEDIAEKKGIEKEINEKFEDNISKKFNEFYGQEQITFQIDSVNNESIEFLLKTTKTYLSYSERSDGLKWYFSLFLKMQAVNLSNQNIVYIIDEPGVRLHVNAQKELLNFFEKLIKNKKGEIANQIIYTTHSPYMIDQEDFSKIKAIIKNEEGYSHIYNNIYGIPNLSSKMDSLTPILEPLGMNYRFNLGPSKSKINIITEGPSDANFLNAYIQQKKRNSENGEDSDMYNIINARGADNIIHNAAILEGWGCEYFILLDHDEKGESVYKKLTNKGFHKNKICFTNGESEYNSDMGAHTIENVFSENDFNTLVNEKQNYETNKVRYSQEFMGKILLNYKTMSEDTIKNFDNIFAKIEKPKY